MTDNKLSEITQEEKRLEQTIALAEEQLTQTKLIAEAKKTDIIESKKEVFENASHGYMNLYTSDDFEDLLELSQYHNEITEKLSDYEEEQTKIRQLERLIPCPYFARIDFTFEDDNETEQVYIGRSSLKRKDSQNIDIYDWRSPIASVFYRFMTGAAYYDAPYGRIYGDVSIKRQYEINNRHLEFYFDTDVQIVDQFLRRMLSQNTSSKMKAIVETIQREQDIVIRDISNDLLMVQGVAGSGKTSIALHRAAFLMYQGLTSKLSANNILILSPNTIFEQYISNVLPELGEEQVTCAIFDDIIKELVPAENIQTRYQFLELLVTHSQYQHIIKNSLEWKTSEHFLSLLDKLLLQQPAQNKPDVIDLYKNLFNEDTPYFLLYSGSLSTDALQDILLYTRENLESDTLYYDDAIAIAYLYLKLYEPNIYGNIRQVVIDEAQDYYPLQYTILSILFPYTKFTVLGDIHQTIAKHEELSLYRQIELTLGRKKSALITLNKSFRCTNEILTFSLAFSEQKPEIESFNREGDKPRIFVAESRASLLDEICSEISQCQNKGYQSIGLLCKTEKNCLALFQSLQTRIQLSFIQNESNTDLEGTLLMPIYLSKGLEFDAVILCDTDNQNYYDADDRSLLHVGCTRALHRLNLFCEGTISPLICPN